MSTQSEPEQGEPQDETADRARERRSFFLSAILMTDRHAALNARVRNLSAGGMMVDFPRAPDPELEPGMRVTTELRGIGKIRGEVAWGKESRFGIRFDHEIDPELARKPVTAGPGTPDYAKAIVVPSRALRNVKGW